MPLSCYFIGGILRYYIKVSIVLPLLRGDLLAERLKCAWLLLLSMPLFLVATVHNDPHGRRRLETLFSRLQPDIIAVEGSRFLTEELKRCVENGKRLCREALSWWDPYTVKNFEEAYLSHRFYETETCAAYARATQKPLVYLEGDDYLQQSPNQFEEEIERLLKTILPWKIPWEEPDIIRMYAFTHAAYAQPSLAMEVLCRERELLKPDKECAQKICDLDQTKRIVAVVGAAHTYDDPLCETLYECVKGLCPERHILCCVDH